MVRKEDIKKTLSKVGINKGDTIFVHASYKSFGGVDGGPDEVIDALLETVEESGTVAMPTFNWSEYHDKEEILFDIREKKSETGIISELFRKRENVIRSHHICHSVAAIGPNAKALMGEGKSSYGPGSTFDALKTLNAWILFLGTTSQTCTALHMLEEYSEVPYRYRRYYPKSKVKLPDGEIIESKSEELLSKEGYKNDFAKMDIIFDKMELTNREKVGESIITSLRIAQLFDLGMELLKEDIGFLLAKESQSKL